VALTGATFNPGGNYGPAFNGRLLYGDAANRRVLSADLSATRTAITDTQLFARRFPTPLTDVLCTPAGTLYVACEDAILRIVPFSTTD
jgi:hypothetical protein